MNALDHWKSRLKASAAAAKDAARNFKGFDAMAAEDDYIHSDDLNVRSTTKPQQAQAQQQQQQHQQRQQRQQQPSSGSRSNIQMAPLSSSVLRSVGNSATATAAAAASSATAASSPTASTSTQSKMPLLSVVQDALNSKPSQSFSVLGKSFSSSSSDRDNNSSERQQRPQQEQQQRPNEDEEEEDASERSGTASASGSRTTASQRKNAHRFFHDLEDRMAQGDPNSNSSANGRSDNMQKQQQEEEIPEVVSSAGMLQEDELQALTNLKQQQQQADWMGIVLQVLRKHPREAFLMFTMLSGIVVFFLSRKGTHADRVT